MVNPIKGLPSIPIELFDSVHTERKKVTDTVTGALPSLSEKIAVNNNKEYKTEDQKDSQTKNAKNQNNNVEDVIAQQKKSFKNIEETLNKIIKENSLALEFSRDKETDKMVVKLINPDTKEVVHQFPPEIALKIARIVSKTLDNGSLANAKV